MQTALNQQFSFPKLIMNLIYLSNPSSAQKHHEAFEVPHFFQAYN